VWPGVVAWAPWLALFAVTVVEPEWWIGRSVGVRLLILAALAAWTTVGGRAGVDSRSPGPDRVRTGLLVLSAVVYALGLQGLTLGLTAFGAVTAAGVAAAGAAGLVVGFRAAPRARAGVLAAMTATLVAVLLAEGGVRALGAGVELEADSQDLAREFRTLTPPGSAFVNRPSPLDEFAPVLVEINALGIRGPALDDPRADVLLVGDSFIEARQLPWEETLGPRLQQALASRGGERVVAHGMRGWSPLLEWNWYWRAGRSLHPHLVLLFFFWNDLLPAGDEVAAFKAVLDPDGRPDHFDVALESDWIWYRHLRLWQLVDAAGRELTMGALRRAFLSVGSGGLVSAALTDDDAVTLAARLADGPPLTSAQLEALLTAPVEDLPTDLRSLAGTGFWPGLRPRAVWTDAQRRAASSAAGVLRRFAADVAADGARLVIVYVPNPLQVGPEECPVGRLFDRVGPGVVLPEASGVQSWLADTAADIGLEFLDPSAAMRARAATGGEPFYLRADCHWSPAGHAFMADWLAAWYGDSSEGLMP